MKKFPLPKLAAPARRALSSNGIKELKDFTKYTEDEVADFHGMGPQAMNEIKRAMENQRLVFKRGEEE